MMLEKIIYGNAQNERDRRKVRIGLAIIAGVAFGWLSLWVWPT